MPYRTYDGYGTWTVQPDTIYDGYGSWIRNPALPAEYDGYGNFWNKDTDPNWIPPEAPPAPAPVLAPEPEAPAPAPAPVAPPIVAPAAAPAPAAPVVDPNAPLGPAISAGSPIGTGSKLTTTGDKLASTLLAPPSNWDAQGKPKASASGSLSLTK
jgi:hypothetical protein